MNRPRGANQKEDRFLDCQAAMEDHVNDIMEAAIAAGWSPAEAAAAITDLADNYIVKLFAIEETENAIMGAIARHRRQQSLQSLSRSVFYREH